jgi:hypothetical protein
MVEPRPSTRKSRRSDAARCRRLGEPDTGRAAGCGLRDWRSHEPRDCGAIVRVPPHRGDTPPPRLPKARGRDAHRAGRRRLKKERRSRKTVMSRRRRASTITVVKQAALALALFLTASSASVLAPRPAGASQPSIVQLSGPTPFGLEECGQPELSPVQAEPDLEIDASLAVNPRAPGQVAAVWIQDSALAVMIAVSRDGGRQ